MKYVCEKDMCAGCMACVDVCPRDAVTVTDQVKHYNAVIDESKCINCGLCRKVCAQNSKKLFREPILWKQGWSRDERVRNNSSSGGFAYEIMKAFLAIGGDYVCSCRYENGFFDFCVTSKIEDLTRFSGSKYIKSNPVGMFSQIKGLLDSGKKVLFLGLPCQVASMLNYTNNNDNLVTVDLICHGTPSPKVLESFLKSHKKTLDQFRKISFRSSKGFALTVDDNEFTTNGILDYYTFAFWGGRSYTENCYSCEYACGRRISDITIGDSWGSNLPAEAQKGGVSLALVQTEKGKSLLECANIELMDVDLKIAKEKNHQLNHPMEKPPEYDKFMNGLAKGIDYNAMIRKSFSKRYYKDLIKRILIKLGISYKKGRI